MPSIYRNAERAQGSGRGRNTSSRPDQESRQNGRDLALESSRRAAAAMMERIMHDEPSEQRFRAQDEQRRVEDETHRQAQLEEDRVREGREHHHRESMRHSRDPEHEGRCWFPSCKCGNIKFATVEDYYSAHPRA